jgi:thiaminase
MGDVQSAQSLYEAWEKHFRLNGKKYKKHLETIREYLAYSTKIEKQFGDGALMKLDHPDIQKSIQDGIISRRSVDIYIKNKAAYLASNMK